MIEEAAIFASRAHQGAFRKGTTIPYITHPMETALIVSGFTDDRELIAAALLHDVVEDAGISLEQIRERFGPRVAELVEGETEDKGHVWAERKQATLRRLDSASREAKILALGDKLSNLRCTARDYLVLGEDVWQRFNEKRKECHGWYYCGIARALRELEGHTYYSEYQMLCESVFGRAALDAAMK